MIVALETLCQLIGADIPPGASELEIQGLAAISDAGPGEMTFISNPKYLKFLEQTRAAAVILSRDMKPPVSSIPLYVDDPYFSFLKVLEVFNERVTADIASPGINNTASIDPSAKLGKDVAVGACVVIGPGVTVGDRTAIGHGSVLLKNSAIGEDCVFYPNVTVMDGSRIGDRVILHAGVVIGSDGFGFAPHEGKLHKIPQIGIVEIQDDVEIGAGTCIDRAAFGRTVIEAGAKLDNLIQIAHNVRIGSHTVVASQVGISGSSTIGKGVKIGGQAGFAGHLDVGDGASVGAQAGVTKDVPAGDTVSGYPAKTHMKAMRLEAALRGLPDLMKKVKEQEKRIQELERKIKENT